MPKKPVCQIIDALSNPRVAALGSFLLEEMHKAFSTNKLFIVSMNTRYEEAELLFMQHLYVNERENRVE